MDDPEIPEPVELEITDTLDLHSFSPKEIADVVESYLKAAIEGGFDHLRIIHGKGVGTQRRRVQNLLAQHPRVISFADAPPDAGSWGATTVILNLDPLPDT